MEIRRSLIKLLAGVAKRHKEKVDIILESPKISKFGDFSSNIALILAQKIGRKPLELARQIKQELEEKLADCGLAGEIDKIEVMGPGFINFFLSKICLYRILDRIRKQKHRFGQLQIGKGMKVHLEFVSANPTGPLTVAHGRQAAFGDSLANVLEFAGYKVCREYYLNDEGVQIGLLGESLRAKYLGLLEIETPFPSSGYRGRYIDDLAEQFLQKYGRKFADTSPGHLAVFSRFAMANILRQIKDDLHAFGVDFDSWFSQEGLNKSGKIKKGLELLRKKGFLFQKEGAWWLATTKFGDDKDRVVIKSDSNMTYLAPDIAYHRDKLQRGFDKLLNVWGPDHHGYICRIKAAVSALGYDARSVEVLIVQLVSLSSADKIIPMSTRMGQFVSLRDIIQAVGRDAGRFFFLMRKRDSHLQFDLELAKKQSLENPVYYIQYAHARIENILKFLKTAAIPDIRMNRNAGLELLDKPEEVNLIQRLRQFPGRVENCALNLEPHGIGIYLQDLARDFHHYYEKHRVVTENRELTAARLVLVDAVRIVLKNGLRLLAISAPEKM